ncbi:TetR family transcriptional regulator [Agromyces sp. Marseille-Q5079]|uniref:TetR family transcriptional regulator n=1 Tax=Agromyces sp. Marseille-Q5079 TaxID=3439059 RepID=UPI003D9CA1A1
MGNREDLLAGARKVIVEQGVAKATARDIAAAAGVSLAAIGYHFGSKEQLITEALIDALGTAIGDGMGDLISAGAGESPLDAFVRLWNGMPEIFAANREALLASLENTLRIVRNPAGQQQMQAAVDGAFEGIAEDYTAAHPQLDDEQARALSELSFALVQGIAIIWLLNPEGTPTGDRLASAIRALAPAARVEVAGAAPSADDLTDAGSSA